MLPIEETMEEVINLWPKTCDHVIPIEPGHFSLSPPPLNGIPVPSDSEMEHLTTLLFEGSVI